MYEQVRSIVLLQDPAQHDPRSPLWETAVTLRADQLFSCMNKRHDFRFWFLFWTFLLIKFSLVFVFYLLSSSSSPLICLLKITDDDSQVRSDG